MVANPALSILAKIERAEKHINDLEVAVGRFLKEHPYKVLRQDNIETGEYLFEFRVVSEPPPRLLAILGDAIHCLRSSLDHLACRLVEANGGEVTRNTAFPITDRSYKLDAAIRRRIPKASALAKDLIARLEPYERGNGDWLWQLHRLDIADKHRFLVVTAALTTKILLRGVVRSFFSAPLFERGFPRRGALKNGDIILGILPNERTPNYQDPDFTFEIVFGDFFAGQQIVNGLTQLADFVKHALGPFLPLLA